MLTKEQEKILDEISPEDGFAYFSGKGNNWHFVKAAIYYAKDKFFVVGVNHNGVHITEECETIEMACKAWKKKFEERDIIELGRIIAKKRAYN